jgi:ribosomal protein S8
MQAIKVLESTGYISKLVRIQRATKNYSNMYKVSMNKIANADKVCNTIKQVLC